MSLVFNDSRWLSGMNDLLRIAFDNNDNGKCKNDGGIDVCKCFRFCVIILCKLCDKLFDKRQCVPVDTTSFVCYNQKICSDWHKYK